MKQNRLQLKRIKGMKPTLAELSLIDIRRTYRAVRKHYFAESNLPPVENVAILFMDAVTLKRICGGGAAGMCLHGCYLGEGNLDCATILLAKEDDESATHMTLVHEMAHMAVEIKWQRNMGHGKHFTAEMRRLAAAGAFDPDW